MTYDELVELARADDAIVGLILTGSRGRDFAVGADSDWDVRLIVRNERRDEYRSRLATPHGSRVEVVVLSLSELDEIGVAGSASSWDRYSYVGATVVVDAPHGPIARTIERIGSLAPDEARRRARERLDDYINAYYRSGKNARAGLVDEARLDAVESIPLVLDFLFAVHERVRPFNRFLRWELERNPLPGLAADALIRQLHAIAAGDLAEQQRMFRDVEALARARGLGDVVDGWLPDLDWLRGVEPGLGDRSSS